MQAARQGQCLSLTCEPILAELAEKLRLKRAFSGAQAEEVAGEIRAFSQVTSIAGVLQIVAADPDDDAVVECAVAGQAGFIVSGDRHLLDLGRYLDIEIITAAEFLARLAAMPPS